jgi:hypothetical protein
MTTARGGQIDMAEKGPKPGQKKKRKMRLSLKQKKMKKVDTYTDSLGWSTDVGRTLTDNPESKAPDTLTVQCTMCGSMLKVPKPKKAKYTVSCAYPECGNVMEF